MTADSPSVANRPGMGRRSVSNQSIASSSLDEEDSALAGLFATAKVPGQQYASSRAILGMLRRRGFLADDPRIKHAVSFLSRKDTVEQAEFVKLVGESIQEIVQEIGPGAAVLMCFIYLLKVRYTRASSIATQRVP